MPWTLETSEEEEYRIVAPDTKSGDVFLYGERAHVINSRGEIWEGFIGEDGSTDGKVYRVPEAGSLQILETQEAIIEPDCVFVFPEDEEDDTEIVVDEDDEEDEDEEDEEEEDDET